MTDMAERNGKNYTIEDIARELGVSKTTVSRALSGKGRIGKDTVLRVRALAEKQGYRPNVIAKSLAQQKTYNLGVVVPVESTGSEGPFFQECMEGICSEAYKYDYDMIVSMVKEGELEQIERLVKNHKVDGIILSRTVVGFDAEHFLKKTGIPFVVIGPSEDEDVVSVDNPNREAGCELTGFMLLKGLRRLALVGGNSRHYVNESRKAGFLDAHQEKGVMVNNRLIFSEVADYRSALWAVESILSVGADGIICMDDAICNLVLGCLRERGVAVPSVLRLASMYDSRSMERSYPPVTSVRFDTRGLGRSACGKLLTMLGETVNQERFLENYQVILRESTK